MQGPAMTYISGEEMTQYTMQLIMDKWITYVLNRLLPWLLLAPGLASRHTRCSGATQTMAAPHSNTWRRSAQVGTLSTCCRVAV